MSRRTAGFTLIELLIVIAVIAVLAAILVPGLISAIGRTADVQTQQLIQSVDQALEDYKDRVHLRGMYPPTEENPQFSTHGIVHVLDENELFDFRDQDISKIPGSDDDWELIDGWNEGMRYQRWAGVQNPPETARNPRRFDLYSAGEDNDWDTELIGNWSEMDEE